jgi:hypothetical protein
MVENSSAQATPDSSVQAPEALRSESAPPHAKKQNPWLIILLTGFLFVLLGVVGYFAFQNYQLRKAQQIILPEPYPIEVKPTLIPTTEPIASWEKHSGTGFYKFSILAPKDSYVCIGEVATAGSDMGCFPKGVYLKNMKDFPYGIEFEQTSLAPDLQNLVDVFGYEGYTKSDISFGDADNQIMVKGSETRKFWDKDNNEIEKTVYFTKYLFTKDGLVYMPKIYTDPEYSDYDTYQSILRTWEFE